MKAYIAGPMRNIPLYNFPAFDAAEVRLNEAGIETVNPAALDRAVGVNEYTDPLPPGFMAGAMKRDIAAISSECDAIILLPGWENSSGVATELVVAEACGLRVFYYEPNPDIHRWGWPTNYDDVRARKLAAERPNKELSSSSTFNAEDFIIPLNPPAEDNGVVRKFETGATRDTADGKYDFEGFLSPRVMYRFGDYMLQHQHQSDGSLRASDNWQKGIPKDAYIKSMMRHFFDVWALHRELDPIRPENGEPVDMEESLCGLLFNVMGYLHEHLKDDCFMESF